jgi:hypothetical protein
MSPEGTESGSKTCSVPIVVACSLSVAIAMCTVSSEPGFAAQLNPSTEAAEAEEASSSLSQADTKIQTLLDQIEVALAEGRMMSPSGNNATEMLSSALETFPLASPQGQKLLTAFPLVLRQHASLHPETSTDFLVFANLVSSILPAIDDANHTDTNPEAANRSRGAAEQQSTTDAAGTPAIIAAPPAPNATVSENTPTQGSATNSDSAQTSGSGSADGAAGRARGPSASVSAASPLASSSAGGLAADAKDTERMRPAPTPPHTSTNDSDHSPNTVLMNTAMTRTASGPGAHEVQQQPELGAKYSSGAMAATPGKASATTAAPVRGTAVELRDAQAPPPGSSGHAGAAPAMQYKLSDQAKKDPARLVANEALLPVQGGSPRELKLALARPRAELPETTTREPEPPTSHPNAISPEFVRALVRRGDDLISLGDISGARQLYDLAAEDGDGQAAKRLGDTYNPEFLFEHGVQGLQPDVNTAEAWYRKAAALGDSDASGILRDLISSGIGRKE